MCSQSKDVDSQSHLHAPLAISLCKGSLRLHVEMQLGGHNPPPPPDLVLAPLQCPLHALPLLETALVVHAGGYLVVSLGLASLTDLKNGSP